MLGLLLGMTVAIVWGTWAVHRGVHEPVHGGRRYTEWLERAPGTRPENIEAQAALRAIGTNAIPFLVGEISAKDTGLDGAVARWLRGFNWISIGLRPWWDDAQKRQYRGRLGAAHLVMNGEAMYPTLLCMLEGPDWERVIDSLDTTLVVAEYSQAGFWKGLREKLGSGDPEVRRRAERLLLVGFGVERLDDPDRLRAVLESRESIGYRAWVALGWLGASQDQLEAWIGRGLKEPDALIRARAVEAIRWGKPRTAGLDRALAEALEREQRRLQGGTATQEWMSLTNLMVRVLAEMGRGPGR